MKETRFFYAPEAPFTDRLPFAEAIHAMRVLRLKKGDQIILTNGKGSLFEALISDMGRDWCSFSITKQILQPTTKWNGNLTIAVAPTKTMERMEWMAEKATEIGVDNISLLLCDRSERKSAKTERLEKIVESAIKQSQKAWKPNINPMEPFGQFVGRERQGKKYIAHCISQLARQDLIDHLSSNPISPDEKATILVGPEGDFSPEEVGLAIKAGYIPVSLGNERLRTETACLVALMAFHFSQTLTNKKI